jgi:hypothetical protein
MTNTRHEFAVRLRDGSMIERVSRGDAYSITSHSRGASVYRRVVTAAGWEPDVDPPFPGRRGSLDPNPDRYLPGSQFPDHGSIAGFSGIDPSTRRIVGAVLQELALDVRGLDADTIRSVILERAFTIGAPRP